MAWRQVRIAGRWIGAVAAVAVRRHPQPGCGRLEIGRSVGSFRRPTTTARSFIGDNSSEWPHGGSRDHLETARLANITQYGVHDGILIDVPHAERSSFAGQSRFAEDSVWRGSRVYRYRVHSDSYLEGFVKTSITKRLSLFVSRDHGAQIADFAAVLPMLVMLIFGILWFGRAFNIYTTVNHAAQAAAQAAAARTCATCGNGFQSDLTIQNNVVNPILLASHLDPSQLHFSPVQHGVVLNPNSGSNVLGTVVTMTYPYNFKLNGLTCCPPALIPLTLGVTINAHAQVAEEN